MYRETTLRGKATSERPTPRKARPGYAPRITSARSASAMLPIPPAKSGNSARADNLGTRSAVASPRYPPLILKVVGSSQETRQDLRTTLRRQPGEPPRLDATFADVSPIPASSKDATPRESCDSNSPFAAAPNADCAGRVPTVPIPTLSYSSLLPALRRPRSTN